MFISHCNVPLCCFHVLEFFLELFSVPGKPWNMTLSPATAPPGGSRISSLSGELAHMTMAWDTTPLILAGFRLQSKMAIRFCICTATERRTLRETQSEVTVPWNSALPGPEVCAWPVHWPRSWERAPPRPPAPRTGCRRLGASRLGWFVPRADPGGTRPPWPPPGLGGPFSSLLCLLLTQKKWASAWIWMRKIYIQYI